MPSACENAHPAGVVDVEALRAVTPGVADHIHFNNAGAALCSQPVLDRQIAHLQLEARIGGYRAAHAAADELAGVRASIGALVGVGADDVAFHQSATDAWNTAVLGFLQGARPGDRVVVDRAVYGSHAIALLQAGRRLGLELVVAGNDPHGQIDLDDLDRKIGHPRAVLVCLTHIPTSSGLVNPLEAAGARCADRGVDLVVDACQSVGQWPVDVNALQCSALSATGRKFLRGPRGTGFLVVRGEARDRFVPFAPDLRAATWTGPSTFSLVEDARRYESWEHNVAGLLGLGVAVHAVREVGIEALRTRIVALASRLRGGLAEIPGVTVRDRGERLCGICTFDAEGLAAPDLATELIARGVTVSVTRRTSARHDFEPRGLHSVVRASVHAYNTEAEVDIAVATVGEVVEAYQPSARLNAK